MCVAELVEHILVGRCYLCHDYLGLGETLNDVLQDKSWAVNVSGSVRDKSGLACHWLYHISEQDVERGGVLHNDECLRPTDVCLKVSELDRHIAPGKETDAIVGHRMGQVALKDPDRIYEKRHSLSANLNFEMIRDSRSEVVRAAFSAKTLPTRVGYVPV